MFQLQIEKEANPKDPALPSVELKIIEGTVPEDDSDYREIASKAINLLADFKSLQSITIVVENDE